MAISRSMIVPFRFINLEIVKLFGIMGSTDIDWIIEKAEELLVDKVEEEPLTDEDVDLAFDIFANPRLEKIKDSFSDEEEYEEAVNEVRVGLHKAAKKLNKKHWSD